MAEASSPSTSRDDPASGDDLFLADGWLCSVVASGTAFLLAAEDDSEWVVPVLVARILPVDRLEAETSNEKEGGRAAKISKEEERNGVSRHQGFTQPERDRGGIGTHLRRSHPDVAHRIFRAGWTAAHTDVLPSFPLIKRPATLLLCFLRASPSAELPRDSVRGRLCDDRRSCEAAEDPYGPTAPPAASISSSDCVVPME